MNYKNNNFLFNQKIIIFDLNGTIVDTRKSTMMGYLDTFKKYYGSYEKIPETLKKPKLLKSLLGKPFIYSLKNVLNFDEKTVKELNNYYLNAVKKYIHYDQLYPNIKDILKNLYKKGIILCIASQKLPEQVKEYLEKFNINKYFTCIECRNTREENCTKEELLSNIISKLNISLNEYIFIGDMISDYIGAINNKIKFFGIIGGYGDFQSLLYKNKLYCKTLDVIFKTKNIMCSRNKYYLSGFT